MVFKRIKESANIKGDIYEDTFLQCFKKLWNKPSLDNDQISWKSKNREDSSIKLEELEKH
jgi:hypothetical protein